MGVPHQDLSGVIVADAVTRLAAKAADVIGEAVAKQHALLQKAELSKKISQFDSDSTISATEIRQQHLETPDEGIKLLQAKRQELFSQTKDSITDPDVKLNFDAYGSESLIKGQALDQLWAFDQRNQLIQKTHFDRMAQDATFAGQTDNFEEVIQKALLLDNDRASFYQAWGSVTAGEKVIQQGQESMVKSYFYGQLDKGNAFKVLKEIDDGRLGATEGNNGIIEPNELKQMRGVALKMATAGKEDAAALALVDAVQTNFNIDEALKQPISTTEERINSLSFEISKKKELEAKGEVSSEEVKTLESQQKLLENVRAAQMSRNDMYIVPDPSVEAEMTSRFTGLFPKGNMRKPFKGTMEEVFKFQQDLLANRDHISPKLFDRLSLLTEKSFQDEINGYKKGSKFKTQKSWFGLGGLEAADKGRLSGSKKLQNTFSEIIAKHDPTQGNKDLFETMRFFFDDLDEVLDLNDAPSLEAFSQAALDGLVNGAKRKMQLKKMGLPIFMGEKNVIYRGGSAYTIVGFDPDGMPLMESKP